tara:strand:- start:58963 stop:59892 length:930 start_codon:yes stop_codon:yes gene_type:complete
MAQTGNEFDIFSLSVNDLETQGLARPSGSVLYKPKPDNGKGGIYESLIRFLPNIKNPRKPYIRKYTYWLEDSEGNGFAVDSPSTIGEKCPVQDAFFKLRNSESAIDKKNSELFKRREVYYGLVQIIDDENDKDLEGQIKVYKFGYKIKQRIDEEMNPKYDEPVQVFDPYEGKNFQISISKQGTWPSYDGCKFQSRTSAMEIDGSSPPSTDSGRKQIIEYLEAGPDLTNFEYTPWDDETRERVLNVLSMYTSPGESVKSVTRPNVEKPKPKPKSSTKPKSADAAPDSSTNPVAPLETGGDLDDFINGLDL